MKDNSVRIGRVSSINYENGMIEVTYPDLDDSVTDGLPVCSFNGEYKMPDIGQNVLVIHLSNGSTAGIVMGPYWNETNKPEVSGKDVYRKELGLKPGQAYIQYKDGIVEIQGPEIRLVDKAGEITVKQLLEATKPPDII